MFTAILSYRSFYSNQLSIVAIPPIGAQHRKTWTAHGDQSSWLDAQLLQHLPQARVLLYNYGELREDKIDTLGQRLLNQLLTERKHDVLDPTIPYGPLDRRTN